LVAGPRVDTMKLGFGCAASTISASPVACKQSVIFV
jgi:hypothetical protein